MIKSAHTMEGSFLGTQWKGRFWEEMTLIFCLPLVYNIKKGIVFVGLRLFHAAKIMYIPIIRVTYTKRNINFNLILQ